MRLLFIHSIRILKLEATQLPQKSLFWHPDFKPRISRIALPPCRSNFISCRSQWLSRRYLLTRDEVRATRRKADSWKTWFWNRPTKKGIRRAMGLHQLMIIIKHLNYCRELIKSKILSRAMPVSGPSASLSRIFVVGSGQGASISTPGHPNPCLARR